MKPPPPPLEHHGGDLYQSRPYILTPTMKIIVTLARLRCQEHIVTHQDPDDQAYIAYTTYPDDEHGARLTFFRELDEPTCRALGGFNAPIPLWHLAVSFYSPSLQERAEARAMLYHLEPPTPREAGSCRPRNPQVTDQWVRAMYGDWVPWVWEHGPETPEEQEADLWHYRVFADARNNWNPTIPRSWKDKDKVLALGWREYAPPPPQQYDEEGLPIDEPF